MNPEGTAKRGTAHRRSGNPAKAVGGPTASRGPATAADWVAGARIRTLPLAIAPVALGTGAGVVAIPDGLEMVDAAPLTDAALTPYHAVRRSMGKLRPGSTAPAVATAGVPAFSPGAIWNNTFSESGSSVSGIGTVVSGSRDAV